MISFELDLAPVAWERVARDVYGRAHVPTRTRNFKTTAAWLARAHRPPALLDGPLKLTAKFYLKPPKHPARREPAVRPDLDNYIKALKDALTGVIWTDDARICRYGEGTGKYYDWSPRSRPRIEVTVERL